MSCNCNFTPSFSTDSCLDAKFCIGVISGAGGDEGDKNLVFTQATPSATWRVKHGLNKYPAVTIVDTAGSVVVGNIDYIDANNVVISFGSAFAGKAYFN